MLEFMYNYPYEARIISNSNYIMENVYFPINWKDRFPEFYRDLTKYQKGGRNQHDDAPDAITGVVEQLHDKKAIKTIDKSLLGF